MLKISGSLNRTRIKYLLNDTNFSVQMKKANSPFFNLFYAAGLFLYPLRTSESLWFSDVFRGYRKGKTSGMRC